MVSVVDRRRLRDGAEALVQDPNTPKTIAEMEAQLRVLWDGATALQSLDDLGSPEANQKAWNDMLELQHRAEDLKKKIEQLKQK